jgi:hypothetical protein
MTDSLVLGGVIELLSGGQVSTHPQAAGAIFQLGTGFDLSAPKLTYEQTASLLLDGEVVTGQRASNRTPTIPVVIGVPTTGNQAQDRLTLAGARELLLQITAQESWVMTWTRDGADPLLLDCMGLSNVVVHYSVRTEQALFSLVDVTFQAMPYGRSDVPEALAFNTPAVAFDTPVTAVTIDDYTAATSLLIGDVSTFEVTLATWVGITNSSVLRVTTPVHAGGGALRIRSAAAGNMEAAHIAAASYLNAIACNAGDSVTVAGWYRANSVARSCNIGVSFYDVNGTFISTLRGSNVTDSTSTYTQATGSPTAPDGTAYAIAVGQVLATAAANEDHFLDDVTLNRGPVYSSNDPTPWTRSSQAAVGLFSARWGRRQRDDPIYDRVLPAALDITGRTKFTFWFGLGTTNTQFRVWHTGNVSFAITLYDGTGQTIRIGLKRKCSASTLENAPHWQHISVHIPQVNYFDYTTLTRYIIEAWNLWDPRFVGSTGIIAGPTLQATAYINLVQASPTSIGSPVNRGALYLLPGIIGTARTPLLIQAAPGPASFSTIADFTTAGSNNWTSPAGLSKIDKVETWGAGAGGGGSQSNSHNNGAGGGGAGEYAMALNVAITGSTLYHPIVGQRGSGGSAGQVGTAGGDSYFVGNALTVRGHGGRGGWSSLSWGGGKGGTGSTNYVHYDGGDGNQANANNQDNGRGGGGGSSGGVAQAGDNGGWGNDVRNPGRQRQSGGPGGQGGSKDGSGPGFTGNAPSIGPGGGGGGGANETGNSGFHGGSNGAVGRVRLSYGSSGILPLASLVVHTPSENAPDAFNPLVPVGNGADSPNGSTEYLVPDIGNLNARFDGTYTMYLVAGTWSSPSSSRDLTVQARQYPYTGGVAATQNIVRKALTPSTDLLGTLQYVDMGPISLPINQLSPGGLDSYFGFTVTSTLTADRFLDILLIDTQGQFILINVPGSSVWNNIWLDAPDADRNLGLPLGSPADRDQASSLLQYVERFSGGPLSVTPDHNNRIMIYSAQGAPGITGWYTPNWWTERLA